MPRIDDFNPIGQILSYVRAAKAKLTLNGYDGWSVEPMIVAESFSQVVVDQARDAHVPGLVRGIPCRELVAGALRDL